MPELFEIWQEKAAILEYCAGHSRLSAEVQAAMMCGCLRSLNEFREIEARLTADGHHSP